MWVCVMLSILLYEPLDSCRAEVSIYLLLYVPTDRLIVYRRRVRKLLHSKSYARLQTKNGAHQPLIIAKTSPDQVTSAVHAWLAVRRPHATTPGDDGLSMASGGTRQVPTTAMTGGMSSDMLRHATSPAADGGCV